MKSDTLIRWIAKLLPRKHRDAIADDVLEALAERHRDRGAAAARRLMAREILGMLFQAPAWHARAIVSTLRFAQTSSHRVDGPIGSASRELRYASRRLLRTPGFTLASVLVLALGLGANLGIFSLANSLLLRPPAGIEETKYLFRILGRVAESRPFSSDQSYPDFVDFRSALNGRAQVAAYDNTPMSVRLQGATLRAQGALVSGNYFSLFGLEPAAGRLITDYDDQESNQAAAVLGYGFWKERFGASRDAVGSELKINGHSFEIVGVAPPRFHGIDRFQQVDLWVPMSMREVARPGRAESMNDPDSTWLKLVGRLDPAASPEKVEALIAANGRPVQSLGGERRRQFRMLRGVGPDPADRSATLLLVGILMTVSILVLVVACANVGNLVMARTQRRAQELRVRAALGASAGALVRMLFSESLALALSAALLGIFVAFGLRTLLLSALPADAFTGSMASGFSWHTAGYGLLLACASSVFFSAAPLLGRAGHAFRRRPGPQQAIPPHGRLRSVLVVLQLALSVVLLLSAGTLLQTMLRLHTVPKGFAAERVVTASLDLGLRGYEPAEARRFLARLLSDAQDDPSLAAVATASVIPLSGHSDSYGGLEIEGHANSARASAQINVVSPSYFDVLQIRVVEGRTFAERASSQSAIVNRAFAETYWPNSETLGKSIRMAHGDRATLSVVGVVDNVLYGSLAEPARPMLYLPSERSLGLGTTIVARSAPGVTLNTSTLALRAAVEQQDRDLPLFGIAPLTLIVERSLWEQEVIGSLIFWFGAMALIMAAVGLYGVIACLVSERRHELGIRQALGAAPRSMVEFVVTRAVRLTAIAVVLGIVGSLAVNQLLASLLYGASPLHPGLVSLVAGALLTTALLASSGPALSALRIDPARALLVD